MKSTIRACSGVLERANQGDRRNRLCKCSKCSLVALCEPMFDFYGEGDELLICERCLLGYPPMSQEN